MAILATPIIEPAAALATSTKQPDLVNGRVPVDGSGVTQPISAAYLPLPTGAATATLQTQPGVDIGDVTINNASGASAVNIQDGGNSLTIDAVTLPLPTGAATATLQTQPGIDIGDVTINNASGAAAVNIQDGGNAITVDGAVTAVGSFTDGGTGFTQESSLVLAPSGFIIDETIGTALAENDIAAARMTSARAQVMRIEGTTRAIYTEVKAANMSPVSTDTALVVARSPNIADLAPASPTAASVGTVSAQIVAANASRKGLILVNTSTAHISLGFGVAAVLDSGITLYPAGAFNMGYLDFDIGAVNAIASAAASNIAIQEYS